MEDQSKIFINYRRGDAAGYALPLYKDLVKHFGAGLVFRDLKSIAPGKDFVKVFSKQIASSKVFLAVIGKNWLLSAAKKRSDNEPDYAQMEISIALDRYAADEQSLMIIPVLVDGATMPGEDDLPDEIKKLAALNAFTLIEEYWEAGLQKLIEHMETEISPQTAGWRVPSVNSILLGTLLGFITSAFVAYTAKEYVGVISLRFLVAVSVGLLAGVISSSGINLGIALFMKLCKDSWYGKILGGALGGGIGGTIAIMVAGVPYFWSTAQANPQLNAVGGGDAVEPIQIVIAVLVSTGAIALGILAPHGRVAWSKALLSIVVVTSVSAISLLLVAIRFNALNLEEIGQHVSLESPFSLGILLFGLMCGLAAGLQIVAMLMIYDYLRRSGNAQAARI